MKPESESKLKSKSKRIPLDFPQHVVDRLNSAVLGFPGGKLTTLFRHMLILHFGPDFFTSPHDTASAKDLQVVNGIFMASFMNSAAAHPGVFAAVQTASQHAANNIQRVNEAAAPVPGTFLTPAFPSPSGPAPSSPKPAPDPVSSWIDPSKPPVNVGKGDDGKVYYRSTDPHDELEELYPEIEALPGDFGPVPGTGLFTKPQRPQGEPTYTFALDAKTGKMVIRYGHLCSILGLTPFHTDPELMQASTPEFLAPNAFQGADGSWWIPGDDLVVGPVLHARPADNGRRVLQDVESQIRKILNGDAYLQLEFAR